MEPIKLNLSDKPNLQRAMKEDPAKAKEVIAACTRLMEDALDDSKGIRWADLPQLLHKNLTFFDLIHGILRGALDVKDMDPEAFDALGVEVHPLAMLSSRRSVLDPSKVRAYNWRQHWKIEAGDIAINEDLVTDIVRKMFRYTRWIKLDDFAKAMDSSQMATYKGLGNIAMANLPFVPALRYQQKHFGDLHVGKYFTDFGFLDCGKLPEEDAFCPACDHHLDESNTVMTKEYVGCLTCNAGFQVLDTE